MPHAHTAPPQGGAADTAPLDANERERVLTQVRDLASAVREGRTPPASRAASAQAPTIPALEARLRIVERDLQRVLSVVCAPTPISTYIGNGLVFIPTSLGFPLIAFADDLQVTSSLLMQRQWDTPTTHLLERILRPGDHFLDVGANIGYFTVFGAALVGHAGHVHAFEPNPRTRELLLRNVRLNTVSHVCTVHGAALADTVGERVLNTFVGNQGGSTLADLPEKLLNEWHEQPTGTPVPVTTLDTAFGDTDITFSCIKIDAEGSEDMIWKGGERFVRDRVDDRTLILLEWNPPALQGAGADREGLMSRFTRDGFSVWRRDDHLKVTRINGVADLDDWCISELILARDPARVSAVCP
jgi:FkbM family methyltransferase